MTEVTTYLHYWDARDGPQFCGWWITHEIGSDAYLAFGPGDVDSPDQCGAWLAGGADSGEIRCARLGAAAMGVRAPGRSIEGAYEAVADHPHRHGAPPRPVYRWARELTAAEDDAIARLGLAIYSSALSLADVADVQQQPAPAVGVPVDAAAALEWVGYAAPPDGAAASGRAREARRRARA